jgi:hypothetical protein
MASLGEATEDVEVVFVIGRVEFNGSCDIISLDGAGLSEG